MPRKATVRARGLGVELKEMRIRAGLTTTLVGERLGWSASTVSRIETGKRGVTSEEVSAMMVVYQATSEERQRLIDLAREAHRPGWWESGEPSLPSQLSSLISFESQASAITDVAMILVPGLLQSGDYARAVMAKTGVEESIADARVAARIGRQERLHRDPAPLFEAFIDEAALRRSLGGPAVMLEQMNQLLRLSRQANISVRALPFAMEGHIGISGSFTFLEFERAPTLVHLEHRRSSLFLDAPSDVDAFRTDVDTLTQNALSPAESADLVSEIAQSYKRR